jgi:hypothetical protein
MIQSVWGNTEYDRTQQSAMTREERLQQANNGSEDDKLLESLILAVWAAKDGYPRKRAIEKLVKYAGEVFKQQFKFNKKWRNYAQEVDPVYSRDVECDALIYLSLHIDEFIPEGKSIKSSLKVWIEFNAINKGIDKFRSQERKDLKPLSSDRGFKGRKEDENIPWEIRDDLREEGLNAIFAELDRRVRPAFLEYIQTDPEGKMVDCAMGDTRCNCFVLVQLMFFRQPPLNQTKAAAELGFVNDSGKVIDQGLRAHWKRNCVPLLKEIAKEIAKKQGHELD